MFPRNVRQIINSNDNSYLYSYQLLGVCSNPNVTEQQIEKLKSNKYNWVKQKAYSVTKDFNEIDTSDRYVLLGLINNPDFNSSENNYQKLIESIYNFTLNLMLLKGEHNVVISRRRCNRRFS